ncbi:MAG: hypothetical protein ABF461_04280 [Zymomonas mobilis subsp. pomaceae]|uniref:Uncharacterized protein n=1 Tax=Zymomonas mobilis subsp. pomaceae (strain ATCC 29192 / DSM 22645 / JCM 10191 / CCUG 17912 / NBRC 13757 / NCIMB 11200 / NRRL B-4491 / Barker I) TaxID=579138 RepID=F8ESD5_ZYMMT|nr:hypothetical protein [Zymomonas mobilis]AEI37710.1 hypothetical protein Zymop_0809 [Zymomonas mobilis subsp. pomaceae ATCC 29192]MDX5949077.1 hypothetical protein [Zymomonas mobilis subsp. pomaceae]GEB88882.1 hypothetical protein ZMO02_05190 [Zymomonas mobilis subsp. pomaceae]
MTIFIKDQDAITRQIRGIAVRDGTGVLQSLGRVLIRGQDNQLYEIFHHQLQVAAMPSSVNSYSRHNPVISAPVTVQISGGVPPYRHQWSLVSLNNADQVMALSPSSATTTFRADGVPHTHAATACFRDDVTDQNGFSGSVEVNCIFTR